jgi:glycosyltransferase involved in cell wall biosynthesis
MPRVTVILPTYRRNYSGMLARAIKSVLLQSYKDFELIVIDDGSIDGTVDTIANYMERDTRVSTIRFESNVGIPALTTIAAYNQSDSDFIAWQFDDSWWHRDHLLKLFDGSACTCRPDEVDIIYGKGRVKFGNSDLIIGQSIDKMRLIAGHNHIPQSATLTRRKVHEKIGWYDPSIALKRNNDWDFWQRAARGEAKFCFINETIEFDDGGALPDSLCNSVCNEAAIAHAFANSSRNSYLHPSKACEWNPFYVPQDCRLSKDEWKVLLSLFIDHVITIGRFDIAELVKDECFKIALENSEIQLNLCLQWWHKHKSEKLMQKVHHEIALQKEIDTRQAFIDSQRTTIDEMQQFINKQQAFIEQLSKTISEKQEYIDKILITS